ncbi:MAG: hypothetical protein HDR09_05145 [Lachnospiraceae bacterium]|nr:hypothetical protein [Lachnospiraceae bacterium]
MAISGIGSTYSNAYESMYASSKKEVTEKQEGTTEKKYANAQEYYDYLKGKYECLSAKNYKVTISPVYLEKCVNNPEEAELLEKNLAHIPTSKRMETAFWSAQGARVVNDELIFDENGNCCGSPNTYVTNSNSSSGSSVQDKKIERKRERKTTPQDYYEKRKQLREQFEKKQAEKKQLREQLEERQEEKEMYAKLQEKSDLSRKQNASRVIERYEASVLKS